MCNRDFQRALMDFLAPLPVVFSLGLAFVTVVHRHRIDLLKGVQALAELWFFRQVLEALLYDIFLGRLCL